MGWFLAPALEVLRNQINAAYPNRSKVSDGTIGDAAHSSRYSDHNPDSTGMVCAMDITHDPANGVDIDALTDILFANKDGRVKYLIANGLITSPNGLAHASWTSYSGSNPHNKHMHVSVYNGAAGQSTDPWAGIGATAAKPSLVKEEDDMFSDQDRSMLNQIFAQLPGLATAAYNVNGGGGAEALREVLDEVRLNSQNASAGIAALLSRDPAEIDAKAIAAAIPDEFARQVAQELSDRLQS